MQGVPDGCDGGPQHHQHKHLHHSTIDNNDDVVSATDAKRCGLASLIPPVCRAGAEAFARRLHSRLSSLGSSRFNDDRSGNDETSWLTRGVVSGVNGGAVAAQPARCNGVERCATFGEDDHLGLLESPPGEEYDAPEFHRLLNEDNLKHINDKCHCPNTKEIRLTNGLTHLPSSDSDSEIYYDTDEIITEDKSPSGDKHSGCNNNSLLVNGISKSSSSSSYSYLDFATSSECGLPLCQANCLSPTISDNSKLDTSEASDSVEEEQQISFDESDSSKKEEESVKTDSCDDCITCNSYEDLQNGEMEVFVGHISVNCGQKQQPPAIDVDADDLKLSRKSDDDDFEDRPQRVRRCSSLKTGKTPPGTPSRKKIVRFADVLGLDLADVRTFMDDIPKIPNSAYEDLKDADLNDNLGLFDFGSSFAAIPSQTFRPEKILVPLFQQPGGLFNFLDLVRENQVCLENAVVADSVLPTVKGTVRVRNLDYHKSVHIRYTLDDWKNFADAKATYVENSCDGFSDKFSFIIYAHTLSVGQKLEFACRFSCKGCQYWDNNRGANYCFQCLPPTNTNTFTPILAVNPAAEWTTASFY